MQSRHRFTVFAIALFALVSCDTRSPAERESDYQSAVAAASTQPTYLLARAGLRFGMTYAQAKQHIDSLRERDELVWQLSTGQLPMQIEPDFEDQEGRLVAVQVVLLGPGLTNTVEYLELQRGLEQAYGESYPHGESLRSWFKGGTEVQFRAVPAYGYVLRYIDLRHPLKPHTSH